MSSNPCTAQSQTTTKIFPPSIPIFQPHNPIIHPTSQPPFIPPSMASFPSILISTIRTRTTVIPPRITPDNPGILALGLLISLSSRHRISNNSSSRNLRSSKRGSGCRSACSAHFHTSHSRSRGESVEVYCGEGGDSEGQSGEKCEFHCAMRSLS